MNSKLLKSSLILFAFLIIVESCSNIIVSPGASVDGSSMISYNADSHTLYGCLYFYPHAKHSEPTVDVYDWDSGVYLGKIPQVPETYNVVGNANEYQVAIGETTFEGLDVLQQQNGAIVDYGSLIYLALQRSKTARQAIQVMTSLVAQYGYYSQGESFSVVDKNEAWLFELIGKGNYEMGAVWVAMRVPDGYITAHANQARIMQINFNDTQNVMYSPDVVTFAQAHGFYPASASAADFSFSDVYDPVNFGNARGCDARVWSVFRNVTSPALMDQWLDYVSGQNLTHRLPVFIKPYNKVSLSLVMGLMGDHYEGTALDFRTDVGAGAYNLPYRWRPMDWTVNGKNYFNERAIGTQQTGFTFVAQMRSWLPDPIGAINWFGVDDASCSVRVPFYPSITQIPAKWAQGYADMMTMKFDAPFWIFNLVCNYAYTNWNLIYGDVSGHIGQYQQRLFDAAAMMDQKALAAYNSNPAAAIAMLTQFSNQAGNTLVADWQEYFKYLFTKFMDGNVKVPNPPNRDPIVQWPGYPTAWYQRIVEDTGDRYLVPDEAPKTTTSHRARYF